VKSSVWNIEPYFASLKERPVCRDMVTVLRTGKPANWGSLQNEQEWAKAMEQGKFAQRFTAAMDCRGVYLAPTLAERLGSEQASASAGRCGGGFGSLCLRTGREAFSFKKLRSSSALQWIG
jgi:hypothetical protein